MSLRDDTLAILRGQPYQNFPLVHFGFWGETLQKWQAEGHIPASVTLPAGDNSPAEQVITRSLGFDFNWLSSIGGNRDLIPPIQTRVLETLPNGQIKSIDGNGAIILTKPGIVSIPSEVGHLLEDQASWEEHFKPRLVYSDARVPDDAVARLADRDSRQQPLSIYCGSLIGEIRNWLGVENLAYLQVDDEELFDEIVDTFGALQLRIVRELLERGAKPDFGHFWEDICCKNGPLIQPEVFAAKIGPWYRKITRLLNEHGIDIVSVDCDGMIDALVPIWLENGVNTMFPIEVGVWNASIAPWREAYGEDLRGVGGMNKTVFAADYAAVDREVERLLGLVELGRFIPCPDHRIAPDAKWENVQYYADRLRTELAKR